MPESQEYKVYDNIDVGKIRNFLFSIRTKKEQRSFPLVFHILYALICSAVLFIAHSGANIGLPALVSYACMLLFPAMSVYTLLYSSLVPKLILLLFSLAAYLAISMVNYQSISFIDVANTLFVYLLCVLTSAVIALGVAKSKTKLTIFVTVTASCVLVILFQLAFVHLYSTGTLSPSSVIASIDGYFKELYTAYSVFAEELAIQLEITHLKEIAALKQNLEDSLYAVKLVLPAIIVSTSSIYAFIVIALFSVFAKIFKIDVFVCIMDEFWTYRLPSVSVKIYDVVVLAFIIGMFVNLPQNISATIVNLLIIMTPLIFVVGVRGMYTFFKQKGKSKGASTLICAAILAAAFAITGLWAFYIISSVGVIFVTTKDKIESVAVASKVSIDAAIVAKEYAKEQGIDINIDIPKRLDKNQENSSFDNPQE